MPSSKARYDTLGLTFILSALLFGLVLSWLTGDPWLVFAIVVPMALVELARYRRRRLMREWQEHDGVAGGPKSE